MVRFWDRYSAEVDLFNPTITPENMSYIKKSLKLRTALQVSLIILISVVLYLPASGQDYHKLKRKFYKAHFRKQKSQLLHACLLLEMKRYDSPRKSSASNRKAAKSSGLAERSVMGIDHTTLIADASAKPIVKAKPVVNNDTKPEAKPIAKSTPIKPRIEHISDEKLVELHKKEDEVLAANHLPVPSSQKHEEIRKKVSHRLVNKLDVFPLQLPPLYFQFNQDEFSVVDMEPFLIAAEYALQGRTVLIEGHTDNRGQDDFNVKLSIKRVEKIRQLMHDMGVPDDRISLVGYGEELGKKVSTKTDHQLNRRVDFTIF
jgi:outer membrane protein OmpA-like peptidoglycan-associated protein